MGKIQSKCLFYYKPDKNTKITLEEEDDNFMWIVEDNKNNTTTKTEVDINIEIDNKIGIKYLDNWLMYKKFVYSLVDENNILTDIDEQYIYKKIENYEKFFENYSKKIFIRFSSENNKFYTQIIPCSKSYIKYTVKLDNYTEKIIYVTK